MLPSDLALDRTGFLGYGQPRYDAPPEGRLSYFDHVRCHACRAMLDPEALGRVPGQGLTCPQCNAPLSLTDLFGLSASFAEEEEEDLGLDDLVSGPSRPSAPSAPSAPSEGGSSTALELMRQLKRRK